MTTRKDMIGFIAAGVLLVSLFVAIVSAAEPTGGSVNEIRTEVAPNDTAGTDEAMAGNVTELTIAGSSITQTWQGYFGNVSGAIQLADSSDNVLYNWSLTSPSGEVYASTNATINWGNIQCFNFTATGTGGDESGSGGLTNLNGTNLSLLETQFNIGSSDADGVDETFSVFNHDAFFTASNEFSSDECPSTQIYDSTGEGVDGTFEEALLYEPTTGSVVYAALLESGSVNGFDGNDYDFEMLVLEDGHGSDVATTTHYFFVEIE